MATGTGGADLSGRAFINDVGAIPAALGTTGYNEFYRVVERVGASAVNTSAVWVVRIQPMGLNNWYRFALPFDFGSGNKLNAELGR